MSNDLQTNLEYTIKTNYDIFLQFTRERKSEVTYCWKELNFLSFQKTVIVSTSL